jgi:pimeloyl-ACP methyl ester carboxylesterase
MKSVYRLILLFFVAGHGFVVQAQSEQSPFETTLYGRNSAAGHYLETRGFKMYYETYGKGEPLLIIHGNGGSINNFLYQIPYFSQKYQVIVADSRSQGKSVDHSDSLSYGMMADDLNALLDSLHLKSCYVIGWSDGAINGLLLAIQHPGKIKKLAITGTNLWADTSAVDPFIYNYMTYLYDSLRQQTPTPELKNEIKLLKVLGDIPLSVELLHQVKCPTLVIGGDHDVIRPKHTLLIAQAIPRSYLWIIPDAGHSTPIMFRDQFNKTVSDFFSKPYKDIEGFERFN